jgi:hypothetical protein
MSIPEPRPARAGLGAVLRASVVAGLVAGLLCGIVWVIGAVFGTNFEVATAGSDDLQRINVLMAIGVPVLVAAIAGPLAAVLFRGPASFLWVLLFGTMLTFLSLALPLFQPSDVTWPTRLWLSVMHLLTGLIVVPVIAAAVGGRAIALMPRRPGGGGGNGAVIVGEVIETDVAFPRTDRDLPGESDRGGSPRF